MTEQSTTGTGRRGFLTLGTFGTLGTLGTFGTLAAPTGLSWLLSPAATAATTDVLPFVDHYTTNVTANLTPENNAAVRILTGLQSLWQTGTAWNNGVALRPDVLRANVRYSVGLTTARTDAEAKQAFIYDRQHQSYSVIAGLGPLADLYKAGAKAVTGITTAPDGTPATTISDTLPADAPAGSDLGAGSTASDLGQVATLVNTVRGSYSSGNPSKYAYQYPRPWRLNDDSAVVDTGTTDALGYPVYDSKVVVAPQLLRQRGTSATDDGGFVSGHTNAVYLAALAYAYAIPERFQELVARASEIGHSRIMAGMHSTLDVIGGRTLATALAAAILGDSQNATLKAAARAQAAAYFQAQTGSTADTLYAYAHSASVADDPYTDRAAQAAVITPRLTYVLPRDGRRDVAMTVPKGAEVLLETRQPYLDAAQRREVLRTTALPAGYALPDGPEQWGRLNLFAAADGYGAFDTDVTVTLNAADHGFGAADAWRNDIDGHGSLTKRGTGALTLSGANGWTGGTSVEAGTLVAACSSALGRGDVQVKGGALRIDGTGSGLRVRGSYSQSAGAVLDARLGKDCDPALTVERSVVLARGSVLALRLDADARKHGRTLPVISARRLQGQFGTITVDADGWKAVPVYTAAGLSVRITKR